MFVAESCLLHLINLRDNNLPLVLSQSFDHLNQVLILKTKSNAMWIEFLSTKPAVVCPQGTK